jgi:hypothetical protein
MLWKLSLITALCTTINSVRFENTELKRDLARLSTVSPQQSQNTRPSDHSAFERRPKIKASDLSKFYSNDNTVIDQWNKKVNTIHEYSGTSNIDLLRLLLMKLQDKALTWFNPTGYPKESHLELLEGLEGSSQECLLLAQSQECPYKVTMSLHLDDSPHDYFQDKQKLQHYIYPVGTSEIDLIDDMLDGITQTLKSCHGRASRVSER